MLNYPADIFSYDFFAAGVPSPDQVVQQTGKFVLGGVDPARLVSDPESVLQDCKRFAKLDRWLVGPSCVITHEASDEAIAMIKRVVSK